ncbi:hypothetical protein ACS0TY_013294 [Phlomoides rotata]
MPGASSVAKPTVKPSSAASTSSPPPPPSTPSSHQSTASIRHSSCRFRNPRIRVIWRGFWNPSHLRYKCSTCLRFRCINVGLMPQSKPVDMDPDMTGNERIEYYRSQEKDYKRIDRARPCLLPMHVHMEILDMMSKNGTVSARLLQKIRDRVQQWYHENGYACAQVVNFGNLNTSEVVCEVVEGDITQVVIQFQSKLGNVCEGNTQYPVIRREFPKKIDMDNTNMYA